MKILEKGANIQLSKNLNSREFDCKCQYEDCTTTLISEELINSFQAVRDELGKSIKINSGFRCQRHNADVGGKLHSRHRVGLAIDLVFNGELEELAQVCKMHFDYIQIYWGQNFIHCHNLED